MDDDRFAVDGRTQGVQIVVRHGGKSSGDAGDRIHRRMFATRPPARRRVVHATTRYRASRRPSAIANDA
jgi:hypothetical protein